MPNPYPATFEVAENLHVRLDGDVTFTDPANQPGGGGGGQVNTVTAGDASITIAGTVTDPTVAVAALGVTSGKIASNAVTQAKLAAKAVGAAQMDSGAASANWVPVADGTGGVVYAASPGVNSLTAADTSIVVGGTASSPTVRTGTLDTIATQHPPTAAVALNSQKITGLANGTVSSDAAAFGQIPTALPPNGSAGGDLTGTFPNPTVAAIEGVAVSGTAPTANQVLTASDATHAAWADPTAAGVSSLDTITGAVTLVAGSNITITDNSPSAGDITIAASGGGSSPLTTKGDIFGHSTVDARIPVGTNGYPLLADSAQTLGVGYATRDMAMNSHKITGIAVATASTDAASLANTLDQFGAPAANVAFNAKKITGLANGSAATDAAAFGQIPATAGLRSLVYRYTVTGSDKASIDTGVDTPNAGSNDWTNGDLLEVFIYARTDEAVAVSNLAITFNNDTGNNYDTVRVINTNTTVSGSPNLARANWFGGVAGANATANVFGTLDFVVPNFAGTVGFKAGRLIVGNPDQTAANTTIQVYEVSYRSTSAITRLAVTPLTAAKNLKVGSQLLIYKTLAS